MLVCVILFIVGCVLTTDDEVAWLENCHKILVERIADDALGPSPQTTHQAAHDECADVRCCASFKLLYSACGGEVGLG